MGQITWYKRYPEDALSGMMGLSLEERGAYNTVLDLIYTRDGKLPDDDRFIAGWLGCDVRVWRRIKDRLIGLGKLFVEDEFLRNARADEEVLSTLSRVGSARDAGKASARSRARKSDRKSSKNSGSDGTNVQTGAATGASTNQNTEPEVPSPNGDGRPEPPNLRERLWSDGLAFVISSGQPEARARPLLGKWRKAAIEKLGKGDGEAKVISLLAEAQREAVSDLVPWMEAALAALGSAVVPFKRETQQEREVRERKEWLERNYGPDSPRARLAKGGGDVE